MRESLRHVPQWRLLVLHLRKRLSAAQHYLCAFLPLFRVCSTFWFVRGLSDALHQLWFFNDVLCV